MPVGPAFEDPPPAENQKPYFVDAAPYPLTIQPFLQGSTYSFNVTVGDPNPSDTLHARWVANYPNFTMTATVLLPPGDVVGDRNVNDHNNAFFTTSSLTCKDFPPAAANSLAFIVSDRPFLDPNMAVGLDSDHRFNFDDMSQKVLTMINWPIIGCQ